MTIDYSIFRISCILPTGYPANKTVSGLTLTAFVQGENPIVDSLAVVSEYSVVAKCANHGLIYMWDLK